MINVYIKKGRDQRSSSRLNQRVDRQQCRRRYHHDHGPAGLGSSLVAGILLGRGLGRGPVEVRIGLEEGMALVVGCNSPSWDLRSTRLVVAFAGWDTVGSGMAAGLRMRRQDCHIGMSSGRRRVQAGYFHKVLLGLRKMVGEAVVGRHRREEVVRSSTL